MKNFSLESSTSGDKPKEKFNVESSTDKDQPDLSDKIKYYGSCALFAFELAMCVLLWIQYCSVLRTLMEEHFYAGYGYIDESRSETYPVLVMVDRYNDTIKAQFMSGTVVNMTYIDETCYPLDQTQSHTPVVAAFLQYGDNFRDQNSSFLKFCVFMGLIVTLICTILSFIYKWYALTEEGMKKQEKLSWVWKFINMIFQACIPYMSSCLIILLTSFELNDGGCIYTKPTSVFSAGSLFSMNVAFVVAWFYVPIFFCCSCCWSAMMCKEDMTRYTCMGIFGFLPFFLLFLVQGLIGLILNLFMSLELYLPAALYALSTVRLLFSL